MAIKLGEIFVKLGLDAKGLEVGLKRAFASLNTFSAGFKKLGTDLVGIGRTLTVGVTLPIVALGGALLKLGADAEESENLFEVSMGGMADAARAFSKELKRSLGISEFEARRNIATFNIMLKSMGLSEQGAFDMATSLTVLANDMASFFNLRPEEAFQKLRAGITGEAEPLKQLGILVGENFIKQVALKNGLIETGEAMTEQQKILARFLAIMEQTTVVQGDLERTQGSFTNQLRRLKAELFDVGRELGIVLIPAFQDFLKAITPIVNVIKGLAKRFKELSLEEQKSIIGVVALTALMGPLLIVIGSVVAVLSTMVTAIVAVGTAMVSIGLPLTVLILLVGALVAAFVVGAALIIANWGAFRAVIKTVVLNIVSSISNLITNVKTFMVDSMQAILSVSSGLFDAFVDFLFGWAGDAGQIVAEWIKGIKNFLIDKLKTIIGGAIDLFNDFLDFIGVGAIDIEGALDGIFDTIEFGFTIAVASAKGSFKELTASIVGDLGDIGAATEEAGAIVQRSAQEIVRDLNEAGGVVLTTVGIFDKLKDAVAANRREAALLGDEFDLDAANLAAAAIARSQLISINTELTQSIRDQIDAIVAGRTAFQIWAEEGLEIAARMKEAFLDFADSFASGFGDAVADAIVTGENLMQALRNVIKDLAREIIAALVKIIAKLLIIKTLEFITGVPLGIASFAKGGIITSPTVGLLGESGPEAVIPLDRLASVGGAAGTQQNIVINLDGRVLTRAVVRGMPREVRMSTGFEF